MNQVRRALVLAAGAAALTGCPPINVVPLPEGSPLRRGPFHVGRAVLGVTPGTTELIVPPLRATIAPFAACDGTAFAVPNSIRSAVYYPAVNYSEDIGRGINQSIAAGLFPLILYAHARRLHWCAPAPGVDPSVADARQDFLKVDHMLAHVASHGFVVVAPDLGWLGNTSQGLVDFSAGPPLLLLRELVLEALFEHLHNRRDNLFGGQLDSGKVALFGHSTGAAASLNVRRQIPGVGMLGLVAPAASYVPGRPVDPMLLTATPPSVVVGGTLDTRQGANPADLFPALSRPRVLVMLDGANHFGFTQICSTDNRFCAADDNPGTINRILQMETAGAYLAAGARFFLAGDQSMRPFLAGQDMSASLFFPPNHRVRVNSQL